MGKHVDTISDKLMDWIPQQPVFFVATAPRADDGLISCSPKGQSGSLSVLDKNTVAYLDITGSGVETIAHLRENGRITLMFCAFSGPPNIVRLYGSGSVILPTDDRFAELATNFPDRPGVRSIIVVSVTKVSESCGFGVPLMDYVSDRELLESWATNQGPDKLAEYRRTRNSESVDGLPGLPR